MDSGVYMDIFFNLFGIRSIVFLGLSQVGKEIL